MSSMSDTIKRYTEVISNYGAGDYADMSECAYGSYASVEELREKLEKALADAPPDGSSDAYRTVLAWLGEK